MDRKEAAAIWPVMKAFAEGKKVQFYSDAPEGWYTTDHPGFSSEFQWRVAPEKREIRGWVNVYPRELTQPHPTKERADEMALPHRIACVEVRGEYWIPPGEA